MSLGRAIRLHGLIAFTLAVIVVGWGVLLSPPMKPLREALGIGDLPGARYNGFAAEIINPDQGLAFEYLGRIAHYYHSLFAALLYGTLVALVAAYKPRNPDAILATAGLGALMTVAGGLGYAYLAREYYMHGLFIAGLAVLFASGALALYSYRPQGALGWAAATAGLLMLLGGVIGGYVGSSYMDKSLSQSLKEAIIASRFDPDLAEDNALWRAWTGHQHAMIALAMVLVLTAALGMLEYRRSGLASLALMSLAPSTAAMTLASYSVWGLGGTAHLVITPAALILVTSSLLVSMLTRAGDPLSPRGALAWGLRLGNIAIWLYVVVPGALIASSLREPTPLFDPPIRDPSRDWMELAFNIGHWHLLLAGWGVALLMIAMTFTGEGRAAAIASWLALTGYLISGLGATLYALTAPPGPYSPNPYDNMWLRILVEPGLALLALGVAVGYLVYARAVLERREGGS